MDLWQLYVKIIVNTALMVIVLSVLICVLYSVGGRDLPTCVHSESYISSSSTPSHPLVSISNTKNKSQHEITKIMTPSINNYSLSSGCHGHPPETLDIASLKTGDIIALSYRGLRTVFSRSVYGSNWTHPALVYIEPETNEPFIFEAAVYKPPYTAQVIRVPLLYWMRVNRNAAAMALLSLNKPANVKLIDEGFSKFEDSDIGVESLTLDWLRFLNTKTPKTVEPHSFFASGDRKELPTDKRYTDMGPMRFVLNKVGITEKDPSLVFDYVLTCHEIIISTLQNAGVYSDKNTACSYLPSCIVNDNIEMANGYKYKKPMQITVDPLVEQARL